MLDIPSYIFGGENTEVKTPEDLARKRALVDAMMSQQIGSQTPRNLGEGLGAIGKALMVRQARKGLEGDVANVQSGQDRLSPIMDAAMMMGQKQAPLPQTEPPMPEITQGPMQGNAQIAPPTNVNMPPALSSGQQLPVDQTPQVQTGAASGQLAALMQVVNMPEFAHARPEKQKMVLDLIQTIQAQQDPYKQIQLKNAQLQYDQAAHPENVPLTQLQQAQLEASRAKPVTQPTSDIQEYNLAKSQGFTGSLQDWMVALKKAGASSTNVSVGGEDTPDAKLRNKLSESEGTRWSGLQEAGVTASNLNQQMQVLDELAKVAPTGPITGRLAQMFPGYSTAGDAFGSIATSLAPSLRTPGSGSTSDVEYEGFLKGLPRLQNSAGGNAIISQVVKSKAQLNIERAKIVTDYQNQDISASKARTLLADLNSRSILTPEMKALLPIDAGGSTPNLDLQKALEMYK